MEPAETQTDTHGRKINYLRISVTDRCNLRCTYCMPPEGIPLMNHDEVLRYEEIARLSRLAYEIGFRKFRITGGEPLVRKGLASLIASIARLGEGIDLALTTNGVLLAKYAEDLRSAGLQRVNISLDTLKEEKFRQISRFDLFREVIDGIRSAIEIGFDPIKINVVVVRNRNDDEILDFVEMTKDQPLCVRFIELMPFGKNSWNSNSFISADEIRRRIQTRYRLIEATRNDESAPSMDYYIEGHRGCIGLIAPISKKFCDFCNRLRLTADGHLLPCLLSGAEVDIKTPMRKGATDEELKLIFFNAMVGKPKSHSLCGDNFKKVDRSMSRVGG